MQENLQERRRAERRAVISDCLVRYENCRRREERRQSNLIQNWMERFDAARAAREL